MKVLLISSNVFPCPPKEYGGLEMVIYNLAVALSELNIAVTIASPEGSKLPESINWINTGRSGFDNPEQEAYLKYENHLADFDIIIGHGWQAWEYSYKKEHPETKILHVLHGLRPWGTKPPIEKPCLCGVSKFHRDYIKTVYQTDAEYAYNGIDLDMYPFKEEKEDYLVFLSRMSYYKGALQFIDLCKKANMKGVLMGSDQYVEDPNFVMEVMRRCDGKQLQYMGEVSHDLKIHYLKNAKALVSPLLPEYSEVFGLNLVEANACGTPVIATRSGAVPEVVAKNMSGFVTENVPSMLPALQQLDTISPKDCRLNAERFSKEKCAERYMMLIQKVLNGESW